MGRDGRNPDISIIGPDGTPLTFADIPPPDTKRWVARRKAEVVSAVRGGLLTLDEACERYALTAEEFIGWERAISHFGLRGLRVAHMREHRHDA